MQSKHAPRTESERLKISCLVFARSLKQMVNERTGNPLTKGQTRVIADISGRSQGLPFLAIATRPFVTLPVFGKVGIKQHCSE